MLDWRTTVKQLSRLQSLSRRRVLRGMLNGGVVTLGLPLLNCFLNENGTALASGAPLPLRFGTWFWGLGMNSQVFIPKTVGANYDLPEELSALAPVKDHINVYTNFNAFRDSTPNLCHYTGWIILRTGSAPIGAEDRPGETIDVTVSRVIGRTTRFQTVTATANADVRTSFSYENANSINASEASPLNFYKQLFGPDYQDPNAPAFTPNPRIMARKSVLSAVLDQTRDLSKMVGAEDRARLEQYFSARPGAAIRSSTDKTRAYRCLPSRHVSEGRPQEQRRGNHRRAAPSDADRPDGDGSGVRSDARIQHGLLGRVRFHDEGGLRETPSHLHARGARRSVDRLPADGVVVPQALDGVLGVFRRCLHQGEGGRWHAARQHSHLCDERYGVGPDPFPGWHSDVHGGAGRWSREDWFARRWRRRPGLAGGLYGDESDGR
jgi:hypothetical protein